MKLQAISTADYLDIIFQNRNKQYGGYQLRKGYNRRALHALLMVFSAVAALVLYSALRTDAAPAVVVNPVSEREIRPTCYFPLPIPDVKPPGEKASAAKAATTKFTAPVVVKNDEVKPEDILKPMEGDNTNPGKTTGDGKAGGDSDGKEKDGDEVLVKKEEPKPEMPLTYAAEMPVFNGDLNEYLGNAIKYPAAAMESGIEGRVVVQFVVNEDGGISNARVVKGIGGGCNQEALRVVNGMPKWKPGKQNGRAVKVYYTLPIHFVLQ